MSSGLIFLTRDLREEFRRQVRAALAMSAQEDREGALGEARLDVHVALAVRMGDEAARSAAPQIDHVLDRWLLLERKAVSTQRTRR